MIANFRSSFIFIITKKFTELIGLMTLIFMDVWNIIQDWGGGGGGGGGSHVSIGPNFSLGRHTPAHFQRKNMCVDHVSSRQQQNARVESKVRPNFWRHNIGNPRRCFPVSNETRWAAGKSRLNSGKKPEWTLSCSTIHWEIITKCDVGRQISA